MCVLHGSVDDLGLSYKWGFYKTLEFLDSRRPDLEIRRNFFEQLKFLAERIAATEKVSDSWDHIVSLNPEIRNEEVVLRNTFFNSKLDENDKSAISLDKKKNSKLKKKKQSVTPDKKRRKIKWVDEVHKTKHVETDVYAPGSKGPRPKFNPGVVPQRSILKTAIKKIDRSYQSDAAKKDYKESRRQNDTSLLQKAEVSSMKHGQSSTGQKKDATLLQPNRPKSSSYQKEDSSDDSEIEEAAKTYENKKLPNRRLLYEEKKDSEIETGSRVKTPVSLTHSNSFKKLDSAKPKRGETPRRREASENEKRRKAESVPKNKDETAAGQTYAKPPAAKKSIEATRKPGFDMALERLRKDNTSISKHDSYLGDSGMKDSSDINNSAKKKNNRSDIEEKDNINGNLSKNR